MDNDSAFAGISDMFASLTEFPHRYFVIKEFMKRRVLLMLVTHVLLAYSIYGQTSMPASTGDTKYTFEFAERTRAYYCFIPNDQGPLPVVVLLHGSGRNGQVMIDAWRSLAEKEHFIIVAPDASDSSGWSVKIDSPAFLRAVVDQIKATHPIDTSRVYLFGHSAGAVHALVFAIIDSHYYASTAVHAGAIPPGYEKLLFSLADRRMRIAIWVGDQDPLFHIETVTATKRLFETNGFPVELTVVPNHDHNYYAISDEVNRQAWEFLKKSRLNGPPSK